MVGAEGGKSVRAGVGEEEGKRRKFVLTGSSFIKQAVKGWRESAARAKFEHEVFNLVTSDGSKSIRCESPTCHSINNVKTALSIVASVTELICTQGKHSVVNGVQQYSKLFDDSRADRAEFYERKFSEGRQQVSKMGEGRVKRLAEAWLFAGKDYFCDGGIISEAWSARV